MTTLTGPEKARFVRSMFDAIARRYDVMNRLMTGGRDESWRRLAADAVWPETVRLALDVGAGTGDLAFALARAAPQAHVLALDFAPQMLQLEAAKGHRLGFESRVQPLLGDAQAVPLGEQAVDAVLTAFTLRNVPDIDVVLAECHRVLRPGGRLAVLELTPVRTPLFGPLFRFYFHRLVPLLGGLVSGRGDAYRYLPQSVERFPDAERLRAMLLGAGFAQVDYRKLAAGTVALHVAQKAGGGVGAPPPLSARGGVGAQPPHREDDSSGDDVNESPLTLHEVTDRDTWNEALAALPNAHGMQTWEWGELRRETGWETRRLLFERAGAPLAAAAVQRRGLPAPLWGISYCPKGPILDYTDAPLLGDVLRLLAEDARRGGSVVLTVEPEAELNGGVVGALRQAGYRPSPAQLQSSATVLVDLEGPEEALLERMSSTWRRYVRKAAREGVTVRQGTAADLPRFYELYLETSARDHFIPRPWGYMERLWGHLAPSGTVGLLLAEVEGVAEAALLPMSLGRRAWYLYGASSERGQGAHAAYLIQWEAMRWARERGCVVYDMWGAPNDPSDKDDPLAGVYYFKRGFGGRHVRWVGAYDAVLVPPLYGLWNEARPRVLEGWRRVAGWRR
ncbi:MAG TPA: ubiquinone/menaquinone biosynthesis methyltransferase [Chloroflexota bacterium]|nr:ubiquinone/menaquinone biosynthesis methyltransferase [Chloroflexota bacterium]